MKNNFLTILIIASTSFNAFALDVAGYIVKNDGTKLDKTLVIPTNFRGNTINYVQLQNKIKYINENLQRVILRPEEIKEFGFIFRGEKIVMHSLKDNLNLSSVFLQGNRVFLKLKIQGDLSLYEYTSSSAAQFASENNIKVNSIHFIYWQNEKLNFIPKGKNEIARLLTYLDECNVVLQRLTNNYYLHINEMQIVNEYNLYCSNSSIIANH